MAAHQPCDDRLLIDTHDTVEAVVGDAMGGDAMGGDAMGGDAMGGDAMGGDAVVRDAVGEGTHLQLC